MDLLPVVHRVGTFITGRGPKGPGQGPLLPAFTRSVRVPPARACAGQGAVFTRHRTLPPHGRITGPYSTHTRACLSSGHDGAITCGPITPGPGTGHMTGPQECLLVTGSSPHLPPSEPWSPSAGASCPLAGRAILPLPLLWVPTAGTGPSVPSRGAHWDQEQKALCVSLASLAPPTAAR